MLGCSKLHCKGWLALHGLPREFGVISLCATDCTESHNKWFAQSLGVGITEPLQKGKLPKTPAPRTHVLAQNPVPVPGSWSWNSNKRLSIALENASWLHLYLQLTCLWMLRGNLAASFSFTSIFTAQLFGAEVVYFRVRNYTREIMHWKLMKGETDSFAWSSCGGRKGKNPPSLLETKKNLV